MQIALTQANLSKQNKTKMDKNVHKVAQGLKINSHTRTPKKKTK